VNKRPRAATEWGPGIIGTGNAGSVPDPQRGKWAGRLYVPSADYRSGWSDHHVFTDPDTPDRRAGFRR
jgi:hypothetical protein